MKFTRGTAKARTAGPCTPPHNERLALNLVKLLTSTEFQSEYCRLNTQIPVRIEALNTPFYAGNREQIYRFDFRHKEMDYSLYSRGDLNITLDEPVEEKEEMPPAIPKTDTLRLSDVLFDFDKAGLKPAALQALREYFPNGQQSDIDSIYIEGHTDSVGSDSHNMQLSAQRCESVRSWLVQQNIMSEARTRLRPFGKSRPVAGNQTAAGRALNRRVELVIFRKTTR